MSHKCSGCGVSKNAEKRIILKKIERGRQTWCTNSLAQRRLSKSVEKLIQDRYKAADRPSEK